MTAGETGVERRTTFLELMFDLIFVFAVAEVAAFVRNDGGGAAYGKAAVLFGLVWWAWSLFTWMGNLVDIDLRPNRLAMMVVTVLAFSMALALPAALGEAGVWFALTYAGVRLIGNLLYWYWMRDDPVGRAGLTAFVPLSTVSPALVVAGGFLVPEVRLWVWAAALLVDIASAVNAGKAVFRVSPAHFAERHSLFVIIALGEVVVATGLAVAGAGPETSSVVAAAVVVVGALVLWWSYFDWVQQAAERRLRLSEERHRGRVARDLFSFLHFPIVAGIIGYAVAAEEIALHPADPLEPLAAVGLAGGIGLFLLGFVMGNWRASGQVLWERLAAVVAVAGAVALTPGAGGMAMAAASIGLVVVALTVEAVRRSTRPFPI
jgi:low temperature requirement protein LtrA